MMDNRPGLDSLDRRLTAWMAEHGVLFLRLSLGVIFLWFGALKFFPGLSPAQELAARTMDILTIGLVPMRTAIVFLAAWECVIGIGLLAGKMLRFTLLLLWLQMLGTVTPVFLFPAEVFVRFPYALTLEGQYIVKNLVLVTAGLVIGATVRGGRLTPEANESEADAVP